MSATSKTWMVAASIGVVEALKDQLGVCRWNYVLRSMNHHLRNNVRPISHTTRFTSSSSSSSAAVTSVSNSKQAEESLRTVMYLSCWGPN
ncbi:PREDICTED: uncharacterized protein LOC109128774 [Camelina sativa]|uniref:Uncharacterized protein LOC109128774 n=1 Tax=Camelina sativa TaxID=90675 RepID=A0ABM1QWY1_CAMSA|nr:PREDICTED: uncharacterized protein LOC109128774 [Camelina sativa]